MDKVLDMARTFLTEKTGLPKDTGILVALSGGPDSVCLLHVIYSLGYKISAAHINYRLRPESDAEEELVRDLCARLKIPLYVHVCGSGEIESLSGSVQMAAREIRYKFFREILASHRFSYCATAHHQDDQVETVLLSLLKGRTPGVLHGIPDTNGPFIRPLLEATRKDILAYNSRHDLSFAHDSSNAKRDYLRNQIRLDVLPLLQDINPSIVDRLLGFSRNLDLRDTFLNTHFLKMKGVVQEGEGTWRIDLESLELDQEYWPLLLEQVLRKAGFSGTQIHQSYALLDAASGKGLNWDKHTIHRDQKGLLIRNLEIPKAESDRIHIKPSEISLPSIAPGGIRLDVGIWSVALSLETVDRDFRIPTGLGVYCLDLQKVSFPIKMRSWQEGDRMQPLGMRGRKKISDIFINTKIPLEEKDLQLIFADQDRIILLGGYRIDEAVRIDDNSEKALVIRMEKIDFNAGNADVQTP